MQWQASQAMKQSSLDLNLSTKKTRKQELLAQMNLVWCPGLRWVQLIHPVYPKAKNDRPPFLHWRPCCASTACNSGSPCRIWRWKRPSLTPRSTWELAQLDAHGRIPDESTILRFRHRLEKHRLADQILATVNELLAAQGLLLKAGTARWSATSIAAPSSTKNRTACRQCTSARLKNGPIKRRSPPQESVFFWLPALKYY